MLRVISDGVPSCGLQCYLSFLRGTGVFGSRPSLSPSLTFTLVSEEVYLSSFRTNILHKVSSFQVFSRGQESLAHRPHLHPRHLFQVSGKINAS